MKKNSGFNTKLIHAGFRKNEAKAVVTPIYQTTTFSFDTAQAGADCFSGESNGYIYTRLGNPTIRAFEDAVASLENGFGGIAVASGMAAVTTVYMALLGAGSHIVSSAAVYGQSRGVLEKQFSRFGLESTFIET